jgi:hypothetical protein
MLVENVYAVTVQNTGIQGITDLGDVFALVINIILGIGWALVFVMLALGIVQYIMSKGEPKATDAARNWLTAAAIGGVGLFFLTTISSILFRLVGISNSSNGLGNESINPF